MSYLDKEKEQEELEKLLEQEKEEELDPDYCQYATLKWKARKK